MSRMILKILCVLAFRTVEISMSQCSTWGSHQPALTDSLKNQINSMKREC